MPKCGCAGSTCGCKVEGALGGAVTVTGTGTVQDPYVIALGDISIETLITVDDTTSVDLTLLGDGTEADPYVLSADVVVGATVVTIPINAGTTEIGDSTSAHIFEHVSTIAAHTVELPEDCNALKAEVTIFADSEITALTVTGAGATTVVGAPDTLGAGNSFTMRLIGTTWRCVGVAWAS